MNLRPALRQEGQFFMAQAPFWMSFDTKSAQPKPETIAETWLDAIAANMPAVKRLPHLEGVGSLGERSPDPVQGSCRDRDGRDEAPRAVVQFIRHIHPIAQNDDAIPMKSRHKY
jgi:hypothetical protein